MKRVHKNILGFSGLALVAGMTACAALMPSPEASAVSSSVSDTLVINVIEGSPMVDVWSSVGEDATIVTPFYKYNVKFGNVNDVKVILTYKDLDGDEHHLEVFHNDDSNYAYTEVTDLSPLDLVNLSFGDGTRGGFGYYTLRATGYGVSGEVYDVLTFKYASVEIGSIEDGDGTGGTGDHTGPVVDSCRDSENNYYCDDGGSDGQDGSEDGPLLWIPEVASNVNLILIKTVNGKIIGRAEGNFTADEYKNGFSIRLHISQVGCQDALILEAYHVVSGDYEDATLIYTEEFSMKEYCLQLPNTGAPDTGGLFQDLNISKEDYLITGLIVFFILGIVGFGVVARNHKAATNGRRR